MLRLVFMDSTDLAGVALILAQFVILFGRDSVLPSKMRFAENFPAEVVVFCVPFLAVSLVAVDTMPEQAIFHPFVLIKKGGLFDLPAPVALFLRTGHRHHLENRDEPLEKLLGRF